MTRELIGLGTARARERSARRSEQEPRYWPVCIDHDSIPTRISDGWYYCRGYGWHEISKGWDRPA